MKNTTFNSLSVALSRPSQYSETLTSLMSMPIIHYENVIVDVGDVILNWEAKHTVSNSNNTFDLRQVLRHPLWQDFEAGRLHKDAAYTQLSNEFGLSVQELSEVFLLAYRSISIDDDVVSFLQILKKMGKKMVCLTNMDHSSFQYLYSKYSFWSLFENIYVSSLLSMRKPDSDVFQFVLAHASLEPGRTAFIDNKERNLAAASDLGIGTIKFTDGKASFKGGKQTNQFQVVDNCEVGCGGKAYRYLVDSLQQQAFCPTFIGKNFEIAAAKPFSSEIFSSIMVLENCSVLPPDVVKTMVQAIKSHGTNNHRWCFYTASARPEGFPEDLDTTSMALSALLRLGKVEPAQIMSVIDDILANRDQSGRIRVYFSDERPRIDAVVCVNVLSLLAQLGMADRPELQETKSYVLEFLQSGEYLHGTRYYPSPDVFLYFLWRLVHNHAEHFEYLKFDLKKELISRVNATPYPIDRAMRVIALSQMGVINRIDYIQLLDMQLADGGWPMEALFIAFKKQIYFGSRELTTAFALEAMSVMKTSLVLTDSGVN